MQVTRFLIEIRESVTAAIRALRANLLRSILTTLGIVVGVTAVIAYLMRWRLLLVVVMSITGFIYLLGYTLSRGVSLDGGMPTDSLMVLVGGGSFIVFLAIYLLFIRSD